MLVLAGPLVWLAGLIAIGFVARNGDAIAIALAIAGASFLLALALVIPARIRRGRRERRA